jgi:hypothetical protein
MLRKSAPRNVVGWFVFSIALTACATATISPPPSNRLVLTDDDYAVYSAVLEARVKAMVRTAYLVADSLGGGSVTRGNWDFTQSRDFAAADSTLFADFARRTRLTAVLDSTRFSVSVPIVLLSGGERTEMMNRHADASGYPEPFAARSVAQLSAIGFNADRSEALLELENTCGGRCGSVETVWLKRAASGWEVAAHYVGRIF